jgi:hypothetical protein
MLQVITIIWNSATGSKLSSLPLLRQIQIPALYMKITYFSHASHSAENGPSVGKKGGSKNDYQHHKAVHLCPVAHLKLSSLTELVQTLE